MTTRCLLAAAGILAGACTQAPAKPQDLQSTPQWQATAAGAGPLLLNMTLLEAQQALGEQPTEPGSGDCEQRRLRGVGGSVLAMFVGHRLARLDVTDETVATDAGVRVGDPAQRVGERYGDRVVATPHKYADGQYLTVALDGDRRLVFETDGSKVTRYRVGRLPEVEWVEGCS